jgi:hypothetical protein
LAEEGARIIFYKYLPSDVPGLGDMDKKQNELAKLINEFQFIPVANTSVKKVIIGKGLFLVGDDLEQLLREARIGRETLVDKGLQYARRSYPGGHYYFISNPGKTAFKGYISLQVEEQYMSLYDPMTLEKGVASILKEKNSVRVLLQLEAGSSCILQTSKASIKGGSYPYYTTTEQVQVLNGKWKIRFMEGGPTLPAATETSTLGSWTDLPGDEVKNFSGTAQYSIHFPKPSFQADTYSLDLGSVQESAEIILNGKKMAVLIGPSYKVVIPAIQFKADNLLQVNVTNGMPNRIADLERQGVLWKKFYNTNFPSRLPHACIRHLHCSL